MPQLISGDFILFSGTTDILLQPEIYSAVIAQLKLVSGWVKNAREVLHSEHFLITFFLLKFRLLNHPVHVARELTNCVFHVVVLLSLVRL